MPKQSKTLGEFLVYEKIITPAQLQTSHMEAEKTGEALPHVLIRLGMVSEDKILGFYVDQHGFTLANLDKTDATLTDLIPESIARRYRIFPLARKDKTLTIAMSDPLNVIVIDEIKFRTGLEIKVSAAKDSAIIQAISQHYRAGGSVGELLKNIDLKSLSADEEVDVSKLKNIAEEAPIIKLVNFLLVESFRNRASDLHIEPDENILRIRNRIDGILYDMATLPKNLQAAVISRCKIISDLNIAVKRAPQDGRFQIDIEGKPIDVRVSTFPTIYGENVVMRLLDASSVLIGLNELGFSKTDFDRFAQLTQSPYGIILVTGPTGSGKTTTLYSVLNMLNSPKKNILTVEDPVEYRLFGIRQSQINPKAGLTFASGLRSILRQDPDIIMVGEIRDLETAEIAVNAAQTGHLVLSTLHTNDAPSALSRLIDMGVKPFLLSSSVIGILAQRLVRTICRDCKAPYKASKETLAKMDVHIAKDEVTLYMGKGCKVCKEIGYKGRSGIFELLVVSERIREMITEKASIDAVRKAAQEEGMKTLREDGLQKVFEGVTTLEEVLQATKIE